ncbi:MAG: DNA mismatch repair endonuclease MutL [Acidobacteria bacterium]|nr:DNA mismatch repair endonuclease MutL [Acidobacteriota bacterium]
MSRIRVLPDNLANQIAAGEVVERPASVVKEMIENSIDAGSTRIQVDIELGGRRLIRVADDGEGMERDDAILAFERHATSKIRSLDDLAAIGTLGFRGEALASIASVAKLDLLTKRDDETLATRVNIEGGRLIDVKDAARDRGTTIEARDLFFNTPARRKFMRSEATENYHLTSIVTHYALAHPEIAFTLTNNGREVLRVSAAKDLRERAFQVFGASLLESLLPVSGGREYVARVSGFISAPRERRTTRDSQYFFINKRFVRDKIIGDALGEGYRSVLPHGLYPVAFLFLEIPLEEIDVNVHPAKTQVRFRRAEAVKEVVAETVRDALAAGGIAAQHREPVTDEPVEAPETSARERPAVEVQETMHFDMPYEYQAESIEGGSSEAEAVLDEAVYQKIEERPQRGETNFPEPEDAAYQAPPQISTEPSSYPVMPPVGSAERYVKPVEPAQVSAAKIKPLGQLHESFIIAADDEGLLLIDQHVAHERILFDKFRQSEHERRIESQNLLLPETMDLTPAQSQAFELIEDELAALGFETMRLSGRTVAIKSVPTDLPAAEARNLLAEVLEAVDAEKRGTAKATFRDDIAASLACRGAVKINMKLTPEKMHWLIDKLLVTTSPTTCPHGRPVILRLSLKDIERGFHRT